MGIKASTAGTTSAGRREVAANCSGRSLSIIHVDYIKPSISQLTYAIEGDDKRPRRFRSGNFKFYCLHFIVQKGIATEFGNLKRP